MWKLTIEDDDGQQTALDLSLEEYTVGRAEDQSIRLTERNISRKHAILRMGPDGWQLEDQGSYNGTFVNGERVVEAVDLSSGDTVQLGDYRIELLDAAEAQPATEQRQRRPDRLVVVIGPVPGAEYSLEGDRLSVGRAEEAQVSVNHASVSRLHAELHALGQGRWEVVDQGSSNGIRINGVDLRRGIIEPGDALEFGDVRLRFVAAGKFFRPTIDLSAQLPAMGNLAGKDQSTQRSIGTILAVAAAVCVLILVAVVMVGGGSGPSTGTASSAAPMATSEAEQREVLNHAVKLADDDVYAAHEELRRIPESSALYDSEELRAVEDRWADAMFDKAEATKDPKAKRAILNEISDTVTVSPEKRKKAAEDALNIEIPNEPPPKRRTTVGGGPYRPPPATTSAAPEKSAEAPAPKGKGKPKVDVRFDEKAQKRMLYNKAASGRATEYELRMLKAICMNDGDRACRNMAVAKLRELKNK